VEVASSWPASVVGVPLSPVPDFCASSYSFLQIRLRVDRVPESEENADQHGKGKDRAPVDTRFSRLVSCIHISSPDGNVDLELSCDVAGCYKNRQELLAITDLIQNR
jgi:hypothetical protein